MNPDLFQSLGWIVGGATLCALAGRVVKLPAIVACLLAGIFVGPVFGLVDDPGALGTISQIGVVLLLFLVGLELRIGQLLAVGKVALVASLAQVAFTFAGGLFLCRLVGLGWTESAILAGAIVFSSTVVAVKVLADKGHLDTWYGRIAVGNSLVQTLVALAALTFLNGLGGGDSGRIALDLGIAFAKVGLLFASVAILARRVLPRPFGWVAQSPGALLIWSLSWCFVVVAGAGALGLSIEVGALLAGLSLAQLPHNRDLQFRIKPLMNAFVAVFFVTLGAQLEFATGAMSWATVALLSAFVLLGNAAVFLAVIPRFGFSERTAFCSAVTAAQVSEFSFILVALAASRGFAGGHLVSMIGWVGLVTMGASAFLILHAERLHAALHRAGVLRIFRAPAAGTAETAPPAKRSGHVIVVGMNTLGREIAGALDARGEDVLAVDTDARKLRGLPCATMLGSSDLLDVLIEAGLPDAKLLVSALRIEEANEHLAYRCRQFGVPCSIHAGDLSMLDNLLDLDVAYLMLPKVDGVKLQSRLLVERGWIAP